jgi:ABC-2 type transport system permease protein
MIRYWFTITAALTRLNFYEVLRDRVSVFFTFVFPIIFLFVFGFAGSSSGGPRLHLATINRAGPVGERYLQILQEFGLSTQRPADSKAGVLLSTAKVDAILLVTKSRPKPISVGVTANALVAPVVMILVEAADARFESGQPGVHRGIQYHIVVQKQKTFNYFDYVLPGLVALSLLQMCIAGTAFHFLRARDSGVILHLFLLPLGRMCVVIAQALPRLVISVLAVLIVLVTAKVLFHASFPWAETVAVATLSSASMITVGYALAGWSSFSFGSALLNVLNFGMMLGSSLFFNADVSRPLTFLAALLPLTPVTDALRQVMTGTKSTLPLWADISMIFAWMIVAGIVSARTFKYETNSR